MQKLSKLLFNIESTLDKQNEAFKKISSFILTNKYEVKYLRIKDLAALCHVSEPTITRYVKSLELKSFSEFKMIMATAEESVVDKDFTSIYNDYKIIFEDGSQNENQQRTYDAKFQRITKDDDFSSAINKMETQYLHMIINTFQLINNKDILKIADLINKTQKTFLFGIGFNSLLAKIGSFNFSRIGIESHSTSDPAELSFITSKDIRNIPVIILSYTGSSLLIHNVLKNLKKKNAYTILLTSSLKSMAVKYADTVIPCPQLRLDDLEFLTAARFSMSIVLELIYIALAQKDFKSSLKYLRDSTLFMKELF